MWLDCIISGSDFTWSGKLGKYATRDAKALRGNSVPHGLSSVYLLLRNKVISTITLRIATKTIKTSQSAFRKGDITRGNAFGLINVFSWLQ